MRNRDRRKEINKKANHNGQKYRHIKKRLYKHKQNMQIMMEETL